MTKEQFLAGINELLKDLEDPKGDYAMLMQDLSPESLQDIRQFDPGLADHLSRLAVCVRDLVDHVRSRTN